MIDLISNKAVFGAMSYGERSNSELLGDNVDLFTVFHDYVQSI